MSDFQRFLILENVGKIKNVKKRKNVFYIYAWHRHSVPVVLHVIAAAAAYTPIASRTSLDGHASRPATLLYVVYSYCWVLILHRLGVLYTTFISQWQLTLDTFNSGQLVACYRPVSVCPSVRLFIYHTMALYQKYCNSNNAIGLIVEILNWSTKHTCKKGKYASFYQ